MAKALWDYHFILFLWRNAVRRTIRIDINIPQFSCQRSHSKEKASPLKIKLIQPSYLHQSKCLYVVIALNGLFSFFIIFGLNYQAGIFFNMLTKLTGIIIQIGFASVVCYFCRSYRYYKHHYISYIVILCGGAIVSIASYMFYYGNNSNHVLSVFNIILFYMTYLCISCKEIIDKWLMDIRFIQPQLLLLIEGFVGVLCSLLSISVLESVRCDATSLNWFYYSSNDLDNKIESFDYFKLLVAKSKNIILLILFSFRGGGFDVMYMNTNNYYSPTAQSQISFLAFCQLQSLISLEDSITPDIIAFIIGYSVIILGSLVFNEIVICRFWGLELNTKVK